MSLGGGSGSLIIPLTSSPNISSIVVLDKDLGCKRLRKSRSPIGNNSKQSSKRGTQMKGQTVKGPSQGGLVPGKRSRRADSPDVTEGIRVIRSKGGSDGSSSGGSSSCSDLEEEEEEDGGQRSQGSSGSEGFPEFPPQLDFMGSNDKSKRRTDRYDSSESSDSGVATLSPSVSDSTELSSSPYSPCYELSSDGSSSSGGGVGGHSSCPSPTLDASTTPPPPTLHPQVLPEVSLLGHPIMTAVSAVLSVDNNNKGSKSQHQSSPPVTNFISFQIPNKQNNNNQSVTARKLYNFKNSINNNKSPVKGTKEVMPGVKSSSLNCDLLRPKPTPLSKVTCATLSKFNNPTISSTTGSISLTKATSSLITKTNTSSVTSTTNSISINKTLGQGNPQQTTQQSTSSIKNIFAVALNFQQQQQKNKAAAAASVANGTTTTTTTCSTPVNNNNNSTTLNKNHPNGGVADLKSTQPIVKVANIKGVSSTTKNGTKSFILHGEGQKNKVIILNVSPGSKVDSTTSDLVIKKSLNILAAKSLISPTLSSSSSKIDTSNCNSNSTIEPNLGTIPTQQDSCDTPTSPKKPRMSESSLLSNSITKTFNKPLVESLANLSDSTGPKKTDCKSSCENLKIKEATTNANQKKSLPTVSSKSPSQSLDVDKIRNRKRKLNSNGSYCEEDAVVGERLSFESIVCASLVSVSSCNPSILALGQSLSLSASRDIIKQVQLPSIPLETGCCWKSCSSVDFCLNLLEHIQTDHVTGQQKCDGYVCLWEGCKVYNKKSSSLSWLERHVLSHSGNKPFKCIFAGCGLSFSAQGALERHVNSHIITNGASGGTNGNSSMTNRKLDSSPLKASRRKKQRCRKQKLNIGQYVDYFDKRVMEVIKHRLATSVDFHTVNAHDCTFKGQVVARRTAPQETQVLVHWFPESIIPDEWVAQKKFRDTKLVPLTQIPKEKLILLYPTLFPAPRREKQSRKPQSSSSSFSSAYSSASPSPLTLSLSSPSPSSSVDIDSLLEGKSEFSCKMDEDEGIGNCENKPSLPCDPFFGEDVNEEDWTMDILRDELLLMT